MRRRTPTARAVRIVVSRHQALEAMRRAGGLKVEHGRDVLELLIKTAREEGEPCGRDGNAARRLVARCVEGQDGVAVGRGGRAGGDAVVPVGQRPTA